MGTDAFFVVYPPFVGSSVFATPRSVNTTRGRQLFGILQFPFSQQIRLSSVIQHPPRFVQPTFVVFFSVFFAPKKGNSLIHFGEAAAEYHSFRNSMVGNLFNPRGIQFILLKYHLQQLYIPLPVCHPDIRKQLLFQHFPL